MEKSGKSLHLYKLFYKADLLPSRDKKEPRTTILYTAQLCTLNFLSIASKRGREPCTGCAEAQNKEKSLGVVERLVVHHSLIQETGSFAYNHKPAFVFTLINHNHYLSLT